MNCTDPLGRTALIVAIENESYELVEALLDAPGLKVGDALLHAINEDFVEAVELLLEWEEKNHAEGTPYVSNTSLTNTVWYRLVLNIKCGHNPRNLNFIIEREFLWHTSDEVSRR